MDKSTVMKNYRFLALMLFAMVAGCVAGWFFPEFGHFIKPAGTVFINMMFCVVVPLVFASISNSVASVRSRKRAGKIMGTTVLTFVVTGAVAAVIMFIVMKLVPPVLEPWTDMATEAIGEHASLADMIVNFFTTDDFVGLLSRSAMLPLIVFSILFGFATNLVGGPDHVIGKFLDGLTEVMMAFVKIITYYAPIAFFALFADLVATYGSSVASAYGRAMVVYYPLCFIYIFTAFPLFAYIGGGRHGIKTMFQHIARPAIMSLGTCSSSATIPTNLREAEDTGIPKDVADMVVPMGATMHMDGSVLSAIVKISFLFGIFNQPFTGVGTYAMAMAVAVLSAFVLSGAPGGGLVGEMLIVSLFGFPAEAFPLIATIGFLVDPAATCLNASGDTIASMMVTRMVEGKDWLNRQIKREEEMTPEAPGLERA